MYVAMIYLVVLMRTLYTNDPLIYNEYTYMSVNLEKDVYVHKHLNQHRSKGCRLGGILSNLAF